MSKIKFRSEIELSTSSYSIQHTDRIISMGSCFAERIGYRMKQDKWNILINPTGIVYNPISLSKHLDHFTHSRVLNSQELVNRQGYYHHFDFHSQFSSTSSEETISRINSAIEGVATYKSQTNWLFLTLGTAWAFRKKSDQSIVANCHKFPSSDFTQELLSVEEITSQLKQSIDQLRTSCPQIKVILTVSPVRHLRHGMVDNNRSKSILHLAVHQLVNTMADLFYFPSYEIMMDDLRDYRFYEEDLIHPNKQALDYIWEKFSESSFSDSTRLLLTRIQSLKLRMAHRAFDPGSVQYQDFIRDTISQVDAMCKTYPYMQWEKELAELKSLLT